MARRGNPKKASLKSSSDFSMEPGKAREAAYRLLTYKPRSRSELIVRLKQKGFSEEIIKGVITRLEEQRYIDDESYGLSLARSLIQRRLLGKEALRAELARKGLGRELIDKIIEECYTEDDEATLAAKALEKKLSSLKEKPVEVIKRRASDYLRRKGFSFGIIRRVLKEKFEI